MEENSRPTREGSEPFQRIGPERVKVIAGSGIEGQSASQSEVCEICAEDVRCQPVGEVQGSQAAIASSALEEKYSQTL